MVKLCSFAPGQNVAPVRDQLDAQGLPYQMREANGVAELWVDDRYLETAAGVLNSLTRRGPHSTLPPRRALASAFLRTWPITIATLVLGIMGFLLVALRPDWIGAFTFTDVTFYISYVSTANFTQTYWVDQQWWRLITPAFLHFGIWHVLFNSTALWELGRRLEFVLPRYVYTAVILVTGVTANAVQYLLPGSSVFGGLSGVVFGLFGTIAVLYRRTGSPVLNLPRAVYVLALLSLVVLPFLLQKAFTIHVANGAHVGGLLAGLVIGLILPVHMVRRLPGQAPLAYP